VVKILKAVSFLAKKNTPQKTLRLLISCIKVSKSSHPHLQLSFASHIVNCSVHSELEEVVVWLFLKG